MLSDALRYLRALFRCGAGAFLRQFRGHVTLADLLARQAKRRAHLRRCAPGWRGALALARVVIGQIRKVRGRSEWKSEVTATKGMKVRVVPMTQRLQKALAAFRHPSEATQHVVACLIAVAIASDGDKRSEILGLVEEFTCGLGIEAYTSEEMGWHVAAVRELGCALQIWTKLAESAPVSEATVCLQLLSYCSVYDPRLEPRVMRYFEVCRVARPELGDEIAALVVNSTDRKVWLAAPNRWGVQLA